jgi:hypothetical protein
MAYKKQVRKEEVLTLEDLQALRDRAKEPASLRDANEQINLHFMPPKPRRKKKQKKERRYRER